jgi:hypothetical protein
MLRILVWPLAMTVCCASAAVAQTATAPPQGAAAPTRPITDVRLSSSVYGAYGDPQFDTSIFGGSQDAVEAGADAVLFGSRQGRRTTLSATAGSLVRQYSEEQQRDFWSHLASLHLTTAVTPRTSVMMDVRGGYSQFSALGGPRAADAAAVVADQLRTADFGLSGHPTVNYGGAAQVARDVTTRSSLAFGAESRRSRVVGADANDIREHRGYVTLSNRFRQRASLAVEYGFRQAEYAGAADTMPAIRQHVATVSFSREWAHSPTRQSTLRLGFGPSMVLLQSRQEYLATGHASLDSRLTERWNAGFGASRDMTVIDGLGRRVVANAVYAQVRGQLSRTVDLAIQAQATSGTAPFDGFSGSYRSQGGSARLGWAFTRALSVFAEYLDTRYTLSGSLQEAGVAGQRDRRSGRVGLTWVLPLKGSSPTHAAR